MAARRLRLKKTFEFELKNGEKIKAIDNFLVAMGHNITKSIMAENNVSKISRSKNNIISSEENSQNISSWHPTIDMSDLEEISQPSNPYSNRRIGITATVQEKNLNRPNWIGKKCPSCKKGFNIQSKPIQCKGCDSFTHNKTKCLSTETLDTDYKCQICKPHIVQSNEELKRKDTQNKNGSYQCNFCKYSSKSKFNLRRHEKNKHDKIF